MCVPSYDVRRGTCQAEHVESEDSFAESLLHLQWVLGLNSACQACVPITFICWAGIVHSQQEEAFSQGCLCPFALSCLRKTGKLMEASLHSVTDRVSPIKIMLMFGWPKDKKVQGPKNYIFQMWGSTCSFLHWRDANLPSKHGFWTLSIIMACWYFLL